MKKKLLLRLCLILMVAITIYSCRTDHLSEQETAYNNSAKFRLTSKRISLNEAKHKEKLVTELNKAEAKIKTISKTNAHGKVVNYGNGVSIDTDNVIYIENGPDFYTYTFRINRENAPENAPVENLVLSPLSDGSYRELLVSYNLTAQEKQALINGDFVNLQEKVQTTELASGTYSGQIFSKTITQCHWETYIYYTPCACHPGHYDASECTCTKGKPKQYVLTWNVCEEVEDTAPGGGAATPGNSPGGGSTDPNTGIIPNQPCEGSIPSQPEDPNSTIGGNEGCNPGTPTLPNIGLPIKTDPCVQLKQINENSNIKAKLNELKNNIGGTLEKGFLIRNISGNETSEILIGNSDNTISYPILDPLYSAYINQTYGSAHNHNKNNKKQIGIFTPEDLLPLYLCGLVETEPNNPYHTTAPKKSVTFVLTEKGYFALKINDLPKLKAFVDWYIFTMNDTGRDMFNKKTFLDPEKYNILPKSSYAEQVTGFLRFMKDYDVGMELYEGNKDTYGDWKKLELIDNGDGTYNFNKIPCNP